jgi:hypothetical protein
MKPDDIENVILKPEMQRRFPVGIPPRAVIIHDCDDGGIGLADIAGGSLRSEG